MKGEPSVQYCSTRGGETNVDFLTVLRRSVPGDGGQYVPQSLPFFTLEQLEKMRGWKFEEVLCAVIGSFVKEDQLPEADLRTIISTALKHFDHSGGVRPKHLSNCCVLELYHGPTLAFKDLSMHVTAYLLSHFHKRGLLAHKGQVLKEKNHSSRHGSSSKKQKDNNSPSLSRKTRLHVIVASGSNTCAAAAAAFSRVEGADAFILYPERRVTELQERQIAGGGQAPGGHRIHPIAIQGELDEVERLGQRLSKDSELRQRGETILISSVHWCFIMVQISYFFYGWIQCMDRLHADEMREEEEQAAALAAEAAATVPSPPPVEGHPISFLKQAQKQAPVERERKMHRNTSFVFDERVEFSVPTGNMGNIMSGYLARRMGLPIGRLILTTNRNNTLANFFNQSGHYQPSPVISTIAPSMDVSTPANFERYLYYLSSESHENVSAWMDELARTEQIRFNGRELSHAREELSVYTSTRQEILSNIATTYRRENYLICPQTATAFSAVAKVRSNLKTVVFATAHPCKYMDALNTALGGNKPGGFVIPPSAIPQQLTAIRNWKPRRHLVKVDDYEKLKGIVLRCRDKEEELALDALQQQQLEDNRDHHRTFDSYDNFDDDGPAPFLQQFRWMFWVAVGVAATSVYIRRVLRKT